MLFADSVRIDLSFAPLANLAYLGKDTLTAVLLDKDGLVGALPTPSDHGYHTPRPSRKEYAETVNEIFWCSGNIAKGIWRGELPYVRAMFEVVVRPCVARVLAWYAADLHGWTIDLGIFEKRLMKYLPPDLWAAYVQTFAAAGYDETWDALFAALRLVRLAGTHLAESLNYDYPLDDDRRMVGYLERVRALPGDALLYDEG
jgi:aminoglycoside 6-adenylyltransferase